MKKYLPLPAWFAALVAASVPTTAQPPAAGLAPASSALLAVQPADPFAAVFYRQALISRGWLSPAPADTDRIFGAMINDVITGRVSLTEALTSAENALTAALK